MPKVSGGVASPKAKKSPGRHRGGKRLHGDFVHKKGAKNDIVGKVDRVFNEIGKCLEKSESF